MKHLSVILHVLKHPQSIHGTGRSVEEQGNSLGTKTLQGRGGSSRSSKRRVLLMCYDLLNNVEQDPALVSGKIGRKLVRSGLHPEVRIINVFG